MNTNTCIAYNFISFMNINYAKWRYYKFPTPSKGGFYHLLWVLSYVFLSEWWFSLVINIIWIIPIAFSPLNVGIAFGGQDPLSNPRWWGTKFL
jgi:hypothetical protein